MIFLLRNSKFWRKSSFIIDFNPVKHRTANWFEFQIKQIKTENNYPILSQSASTWISSKCHLNNGKLYPVSCLKKLKPQIIWIKNHIYRTHKRTRFSHFIYLKNIKKNFKFNKKKKGTIGTKSSISFGGNPLSSLSELLPTVPSSMNPDFFLFFSWSLITIKKG